MTASRHFDECLWTFQGQQFVTHGLESPDLVQRLNHFRGGKVVLRFDPNTPYRCFGAAIITLQQAGVKFRTPQIPSR